MRSTWRFGRRLRMLIGTGQFARTEELIRFFAGKLGAPGAIAALDRPIDQIRIEGWDTIGARMEDKKRYLRDDDKGREWRAVILGLRNDTAVDGLHVQTRFSLSDEARPLSLSSSFLSDLEVREQERMLATQTRVPSADLVTIDAAPLRLSGLDDLYALEVGQPGPYSERRACIQDLAAAAILLRFHQAVERHAMNDGLPRALPIYATVSPVSRPMEVNAINFGEVATRRLMPVVGDFADRTAVLMAEAAREREDEFIQDTRRLVTQLREKDAVLALWPAWQNPFKRQAFAEQVRIGEKATRDALRRMHGIDAAGAAGEALIRLLVEARHGKVTPDLLESLPPQDCFEIHQISMAYAKRFGGRRVRAYLIAHPDRPAVLDGIAGAK